MPKRKAVVKEAVKDKIEEESSDPALDKILKDTLQEVQTGKSLKWLDVECPFCGEEFEVRVDPSEEGQDMVEDCRVCCKPVQLSVEVEDGEVSVMAYRE